MPSGIYVSAFCAVIGVMGFFLWLNKNELDSAKEFITTLQIANNQYELQIAKANETISKNSRILDEMHQNNKKEVVYVTREKTKIIRENNSTCLDAINAIYARMRKQSGDSAK